MIFSQRNNIVIYFFKVKKPFILQNVMTENHLCSKITVSFKFVTMDSMKTTKVSNDHKIRVNYN